MESLTEGKSKMTEQIDFVITYVDGTDPLWQEKRARYRTGEGADGRLIRYRSWDNLRYWFRSVEKYAPWVRKVFLVTDDQVPDWIDPACEKLVLVSHKDYIPEEYLPVFSSHPIELNLHRIKGLSEQFVYFNDDTFLLQPVRPEQFFSGGLPCDYAIESPYSVYDPVFAHVLANNIILLNEHYSRSAVLKKQRKKFYSPADPRGMMQNLMFKSLRRDRFFGFESGHMPNSYRKETLAAVWEQSGSWLDATCRSRFRSDRDVNQYVFQHHQYVNGMYTPYSWGKRRHLIRLSDENAEQAAELIRSAAYTMVCINEAEDLDFERAKEMINGAFASLLPETSVFEKNDKKGE